MLKLEQISKTLEISIILRPRTPFFTHSLKCALIIALSVHILIGLLFSVQLIKFSENLQNYTPVYVESESMGALSHQALADLEKDEMYFRYLGEPPDSKPDLPISHFKAEEQALVDWRAYDNVKTHAFLKVENWILTPSIPLLSAKRSLNVPIQIKLSGGIEKYALLGRGCNSEVLALLKKMKPERYAQTYYVRVDMQRGEIFWYEPIGGSKSRKTDQIVERILSCIRLEVQDASEAISSGYIEVTLFKQEEAYD